MLKNKNSAQYIILIICKWAWIGLDHYVSKILERLFVILELIMDGIKFTACYHSMTVLLEYISCLLQLAIDVEILYSYKCICTINVFIFPIVLALCLMLLVTQYAGITGGPLILMLWCEFWCMCQRSHTQLGSSWVSCRFNLYIIT